MNRTLASGCLLLLSSLIVPHRSLPAADAAPRTDPRYPFRTDFASEALPWYQPKPLEFPPHHSDRRISGELVSADFVHRKGQFRASRTGELMDFTMPPYGAVNYLNAEADLRDVPLGTFFLFFLNQDTKGGFTRLATMQDQYTMDAGHGFSYRLDEARLAEGKLLTTKHSLTKKQDDLGKKELLVRKETRVWNGDRPAALEDLKPGDELLFNLTGKSASDPGWCTDIWVGTATHLAATAAQAKKFAEFTRARGLPGWIEKTEGNTLTVTFFSGDTRAFKATWGPEFVAGKDVRVCVANDELRTWNPPVDGERGSILEVSTVPADSYGCSGLRAVMRVSNMLEGFRKGRVVRVFGPGWKVQDQFYGESLMGYGFGRMLNEELKENPAKEYPEQFPFRTEYGNDDLSWYTLKPGVKPPPFAEHVVYGELVKADNATGSGQFRAEPDGTTVEFTLIPDAAVRCLNAAGALSDIPPGTRCRFHLYQNEKGAFTKAGLVADDFSWLSGNATTLRVESVRLDEGRLRVAWQIPEVKDYNGDMQQPPAFGRSELRVDSGTRVWKDGKEAALASLATGDLLLVNQTAELPGAPSRCTEIWIGEETHKAATDARRKKPAPAAKPRP